MVLARFIESIRRWPIALAAAALAAMVSPAPHARADAPPCQYETSPDTVTDKRTKLVWQRQQATLRNWNDAVAYCAGLTLAGIRWRLPTIQELQTLVDVRRASPTIDLTAFPTTSRDIFWSSSIYVPDTTRRWVVDFSNGGVGQVPQTSTYPIRCVSAQ